MDIQKDTRAENLLDTEAEKLSDTEAEKLLDTEAVILLDDLMAIHLDIGEVIPLENVMDITEDTRPEDRSRDGSEDGSEDGSPGNRRWIYELRYGNRLYKSPSSEVTYRKRCR